MKVICQEYEWEFDVEKARLTCKRHGKQWRDETGDGAVLALLQECDRLQTIVQQRLSDIKTSDSRKR